MDWSYLAGFVDGEGSISLSRGGSYRYKNVPRIPTYRPLLAISNNHRGVLERIREFVGFGTVQKHTRSSPNQRPSFTFQAQGLRIESILSSLQPLLIIKQAQAGIALEFIERRKQQRTRPFTVEDYALVEEMQRLNNRAPGKGTPIRPIPSPRNRAVYGSIGKPSIARDSNHLRSRYSIATLGRGLVAREPTRFYLA